jgi:AP-2 complex subunit alpha
MSLSIRGLNIFISDLRNCPNKEAEVKRVEIEKQKIRQKFAGKSTINGYDRKKYIWKLIYIKLLGHEVDFGYKEAAMLINSQKHSEKYTGYVATS